MRRVDDHSCCQFTKQETGLRQGGLKIFAGQQKGTEEREKYLKDISLHLAQILGKFCIRMSEQITTNEYSYGS